MLTRLPSEVPVPVPKFISVWVFFINSIFTFSSWGVLFISLYSLCFHRFCKRFIHSSLMSSIIFINATLRSLSCAAVIFQYLGPALVGLLGSNGDIVSWLLIDYISSVYIMLT